MAKHSREEFEAVARTKAAESHGARKREIDRLIVERGLQVEPYGVGHRIVGFGVDLLIADLRTLTLGDLQPVRDSSVLLGNRYR